MSPSWCQVSQTAGTLAGIESRNSVIAAGETRSLKLMCRIVPAGSPVTAVPPQAGSPLPGGLNTRVNHGVGSFGSQVPYSAGGGWNPIRSGGGGAGGAAPEPVARRGGRGSGRRGLGVAQRDGQVALLVERGQRGVGAGAAQRDRQDLRHGRAPVAGGEEEKRGGGGPPPPPATPRPA